MCTFVSYLTVTVSYALIKEETKAPPPLNKKATLVPKHKGDITMTDAIDPRLIKVTQPTLEEVEVIAASLGYRLVNMSTVFTGYYMWRLYRDGLLVPSNQYGGGLNLVDVRDFLEAERYSKRFDVEVPSAVETVHSHALGVHRAVVKNITECGYAIACQLSVVLDEPDWFYRDDDDRIFADLDAARARMRMELDSDRAANFELSRGGLI